MGLEEWELAIGVGYHLADLEKAGSAFGLKEGDLESDWCQVRCAWTLQEVGQSRVIAGFVLDGLMHAECRHMRYRTPPVSQLDLIVCWYCHEQLTEY